jgi:hypothetical protein
MFRVKLFSHLTEHSVLLNLMHWGTLPYKFVGRRLVFLVTQKDAMGHTY